MSGFDVCLIHRQSVCRLALLFLALSVTLNPRANADDQPAESTESRDFTVDRQGEKLSVRVVSPKGDKLAKNPLLLLNFSTDRTTSLTAEIYAQPAKAFLANGHRVASFDLPAHGERVDARGSGIDGMCAQFIAGDDPFARFAADGSAVIDALIQSGDAVADRIVVCGVSRAGYCGLRLAAADKRVCGVAALAPVTDWRQLREFAAVKERDDVAKLALDHFADALAGRPVYMAIGNRDERVGTDCCTRFALKLFEAEERKKQPESKIRFLVVDDSKGHALDLKWRDAGSEFLLKLAK
ncbi:MAG: alpha/beta fold hydrolase [Planctomycetota bacterium]|nr:alpha/beta fold hydrolase [Planctomycetota bacterium]